MPERPDPAVEALMEVHMGLCREEALRLSPGLERDEDAMQAARIGLWEAARGWDRRRPFPPYARTCIRHNVIDHLRTQAPETAPLPEELAAPSEREGQPPETREELAARIRSLFPRRSLERRVLLSLLAGRTKGQTAARLHLSPRTISRAARRGWEKLDKQKELDG